MKYPYICVAGVNTLDGAHVRPLSTRQHLSINDLVANGGVFDVGAIVDLGRTQSAVDVPQTENCTFQLHQSSNLGYVASHDLWDIMRTMRKSRFTDIFGPSMRRYGRTAALAIGCGDSSIGYFQLSHPADLYINERKQVRIAFSDAIRFMDLPVTDLRLYDAIRDENHHFGRFFRIKKWFRVYEFDLELMELAYLQSA